MSIDKTNTDYNDFIELDEIVFENRNKGYGAYNLRKIYGGILAKSFVFGTAVFLVMVITPFIYMTIKAGEVKEEIVVSVDLTDIKDLPPPPKEELEAPPPPPPPKKEEAPVEIIKDVVPEPKPNPEIEEPPKKIEEVVGTTIGTIDQKGEKKAEYIPPPPPVTGGTGFASDMVHDIGEIDQEAEFAGGIDRFRNLFQSRFDNSSLEGEEGILRTEITFVVERDGTITDIKANGSNADFNREAIRTIKTIKNKWNPAKLNGQVVRSRFRFPVTMTFD